MTSAQTVVLGVGAVLAGAVVGSFLCVLIDRLPRRLDEPNEFGELYDMAPWREVLGGTSRCSDCGAAVRWFHNVPVLSWLVLRGRCADCGARIPAFHPLVEVAVPAVGAAVVWSTGWSWLLPLYLWLVPVGVVVAVIDWRTLMVPTKVVWPAFGVALALSLLAVLAEGEPRWLLGALIGVAVLSGPLFVLWWFLPSGMGFGDVRLTVLLGWIVGFAAVAAGGSLPSAVLLALSVMVVASVLGLLLGVLVALFGARSGDDTTPLRKRQVPFGPSLVAASLLAIVVVDGFVAPIT